MLVNKVDQYAHSRSMVPVIWRLLPNYLTYLRKECCHCCCLMSANKTACVTERTSPQRPTASVMSWRHESCDDVSHVMTSQWQSVDGLADATVYTSVIVVIVIEHRPAEWPHHEPATSSWWRLSLLVWFTDDVTWRINVVTHRLTQTTTTQCVSVSVCLSVCVWSLLHQLRHIHAFVVSDTLLTGCRGVLRLQPPLLCPALPSPALRSFVRSTSIHIYC